MNNNISKVIKISFTMMNNLTINKLSNKFKNNIFSKILILDFYQFSTFSLFIFLNFNNLNQYLSIW